jgi:hypothetical protein
MVTYAGIGSRQTPEKVLTVMEKLGVAFANKGFVLRSGGVDGADKSFEIGCDKVNGQKEIYLPWKNFNNSESELFFENLPKEAVDLAFKYHPNLHNCTYGVIKMMTRNICQILGKDCNTPSNFVVCYTADGEAAGGTGQALRAATDHNIPIFNLYFAENLEKLKIFVKDI